MISCTEWPLYRIFGRYSIIDMTVRPCTERGQYIIPLAPSNKQYNHWAEPSTPRQKNHHLSAEPLALSNITIGPSRQHRGKNHHISAKPLAPSNITNTLLTSHTIPTPIPLGPSISIGYSSTTSPPVRNTYNIQWAHHRMARLTRNIVNLGCPLEMD